MATPTSWQIHWRVPFVSLNGTAYTVLIYEIGYGDAPVTLKGAPVPFVTQENDSDDIFTAIRRQTGTLRVVLSESESSYLQALMPANNTEKLVTLTHVVDNVSVIDWQGFMQARMFTQPWSDNAHVVEFPLNGMLASLEHKRVPTSLANSGTTRVLGVITTALESLGDFFGGVDNIDDNEGKWMTALVDWNAFFTSDSEQEEGYKKQVQYGISYLEAVERVCTTFGLIAREHGNRIILAQYDGGSDLSLRSLTWAAAKNIADGTSAPSSGSVLPTEQDLVATATWRGSENQANYLPGAHEVAIRFTPGAAGDSVVIAAPTQDFDESEEAIEVALNDSTVSRCWVQCMERNDAKEVFENKGLMQQSGSPTGYTAISAEQVREGWSVLGSGVHPSEIPTVNWASGAWPCIFGAKYDQFENVNMQPGIFIQQIAYENEIATYYSNFCYELISAGPVTIKAGSYININFTNHSFRFYGWSNGKANEVYFDWNGLDYDNITVFNLMVMVGSNAYAGTTDMRTILGELKVHNMENYGEGSWISSQLKPTVCIATRNKEVITNEIDNPNMISFDGGFLIPVPQDITGVMRIAIGNICTVSRESVFEQNKKFTSKIFTDFQVRILQTAPPYYSGSNTNVYKANLDNSFKGEKTTELKLGTINCNQPSPTLLLSKNGNDISYLKTLQYTSGQTERPERHLLNRMAAYYGETRRAYDGQILQGLDLWTRRWLIGGRTYMGVDTIHEWDMNRQKVRFIEVTTPSE